MGWVCEKFGERKQDKEEEEEDGDEDGDGRGSEKLILSGGCLLVPLVAIAAFLV
jgi:hypothetical protein